MRHRVPGIGRWRLGGSLLGRSLLLALLCGLWGASLCPAAAGAQGGDTPYELGPPSPAQDRVTGRAAADSLPPEGVDRAQSTRPMAVCAGLSAIGLALVGGVIGYVVRRDSRALAPALEAGGEPVCGRCGVRLERGARACHGCHGAV